MKPFHLALSLTLIVGLIGGIGYNPSVPARPHGRSVSALQKSPSTPTLTPPPTSTATATPTVTPTPTTTATHPPTATPTPLPSPTATPTPLPSPTATPTPLPLPTATLTPTVTPTPTLTPTPTPTAEPTPYHFYLMLLFNPPASPQPTATPTRTPPPPTATPGWPTPTATASPTPLPTETPISPTATAVPPTATPPPPTATPLPSPTNTPTASPPPTSTPIPPTSTATPPPTPVCGEIIENGDFEQGHVAWIEESAGGYEIITQGWENPYQGSWVAWFGGYDNADDLLTQIVPVPPNAQDEQVITFYLYVNSNDDSEVPYDEFVLRFLDEAGNPISNDIHIADNTQPTDWVLTTVPLSGFGSVAGQNIQVQFEGTTDGSLWTNFVIDLVSLEIVCGLDALPPPGPPWILPAR